MRRSRYIYVPQQVKDAIKNHLDDAIAKGTKGYRSAFEDEDVLTGHLFGLMNIEEQRIDIDDVEMGGTWKWSIDYKKFGGRGKGATESIIGADGIFELSMIRNNEIVSKSLLFQFKLDWKNKDQKVYAQSAKLVTWMGAAIIVNYTQEKIETYSLGDVLAHQGRKPTDMKPLDQLLGGDFVNCDVGSTDLKYDAFQKRLIWVDSNDEKVAVKFNLTRRLKITVAAPKKNPFYDRKIDKIISTEQISLHPLNASLNEYNVWNADDLKQLKDIQNQFVKSFHPDKHSSLPPMQISAFSELLKHFNNEIDQRKKYLTSRDEESR